MTVDIKAHKKPLWHHIHNGRDMVAQSLGQIYSQKWVNLQKQKVQETKGGDAWGAGGGSLHPLTVLLYAVVP